MTARRIAVVEKDMALGWKNSNCGLLSQYGLILAHVDETPYIRHLASTMRGTVCIHLIIL